MILLIIEAPTVSASLSQKPLSTTIFSSRLLLDQFGGCANSGVPHPRVTACCCHIKQSTPWGAETARIAKIGTMAEVAKMVLTPNGMGVSENQGP